MDSGTTNTADAFVELVEKLRKEFPKLKFVPKTESVFCRFVDALLRMCTFGRMRSFLESYYTTIGCTVFLPKSFDKYSAQAKCIALRHEAVHLRQWRDLGYFGMTVTYLLLLLPIGLALGRAFLEQEAYEETIRATADYYGVDAVRQELFKKSIVEQFTGPAYLWMWPFPAVIESWYDRFVDRLELSKKYS